MFTNFGTGTSQSFRALVAVVIVGITGAVLENGQREVLPQGVVELGELVPVSVGGESVALLPEIVISASRLAPEPAMLADGLPRLPEVVVVGQRETRFAAAAVARDDSRG